MASLDDWTRLIMIRAQLAKCSSTAGILPASIEDLARYQPDLSLHQLRCALCLHHVMQKRKNRTNQQQDLTRLPVHNIDLHWNSYMWWWCRVESMLISSLFVTTSLAKEMITINICFTNASAEPPPPPHPQQRSYCVILDYALYFKNQSKQGP